MRKYTLTDKQQRFVEYYANPESPTYGVATTSYVKAGYAKSHTNAQAASRLVNSVNVIKAMRKYQPESVEKAIKKVEITKDYALGQLQETYETCKRKQDMTNQVACMRLILQATGLLTERITVTHTDALQLERSLQSQCRTIASILIKNKHLLPADTGQGHIDDGIPYIQDVVPGIESQFIESEATDASDDDE